MDYLETLRQTTISAQEEQNLPDDFAERIFSLVEALRGTGMFAVEIHHLNEQVAEYDTFAQTGYMGMGVDNLILDKTLNRIEVMTSNQRSAG